MTKMLDRKASIWSVADRISKGTSKQTILKQLQEEGMTLNSAYNYYYDALKELAPEDTIIDEYKRGMMQANLNRLEQIIETSISGNSQDKQVALKAIDQISKILGFYNEGNKVTVANNKEGEQIIQIEFGQ